MESKLRFKEVFAAAVVVASTALPLAAQTVDVSTITCADTAEMSPEALQTVIIFIDGFTGGASEDPNLNFDRLGSDLDFVAAKCAENPEATLMDLMAEALGG